MPSEKHLRIHPALRERAREFRQPLTPAEADLWRALRGRNLSGYKFRRQHPIDRFIVDFYCAEKKLVIEVDGDVHATQEAYDAARTEWLEAQGYIVIRFTNTDVLKNPDRVAAEILRRLEELNR